MKKLIYLPALIFVLLLSFKTTIANHVYGSETRWRNLGSDTFEITIVVYYRCTDGPPAALLLPPTITSDSCLNAYSISTGYIIDSSVADITPVCSTQQRPCAISGGSGSSSAQIPVGYQKNTWKYKIYLGGVYSGCCWYKVHWESCCRSSGSGTGFSNQNFMNDVWLNRCVMNNSPEFTNEPMVIKCAGQDVVYNNGAVDDEHDSLSYRMAQPLGGSYTSPWSYTYPLTCLGGNNPNINNNPPLGFNLDAIRGDILFRPLQVQGSVIKVEVLEWRKINGVYKIIGKTSRDICPIIIQNCGNKLPSLSGPFNYQVCAGQQICININTTDNDIADTTRIYSNALLAIPNATWSVTLDSAKRAKSTLCWNPVDTNISSLPYYFNVIVKDNHCPLYGTTSRAYSITVIQTPHYTTSISRMSGSLWKFEATPVGSYTYTAYQWYVPTLLGQGISTQVFDVAQTTNYSFTKDGKYLVKSIMFNNTICNTERIDTIDVYCATPLKLKSNNDTSLCNGSSFTLTTLPLNGTAPYKYKWYRNGTLVDSVQTIIQTPSLNAEYIVKVTSSDTCQYYASDTVNVFVDTSTLAITHINDIRICKGSPVSLSPQITGSKIQSFYRWYYNGVMISTSKILIHLPSLSGTYVFEIQSNGFCPLNVKDTINISLDTNTLSLIPLKDFPVCAGTPISLSPIIKTGQAPFSYIWYKNGVLFSTNRVLTDTPFATATYVIRIISNDSCKNIAHDTLNVSVYKSDLQTKLPNDTAICSYETLSLKSKTTGDSGIYVYQWYMDGAPFSNAATINFTPSTVKKYELVLKVKSTYYCDHFGFDTMFIDVFPLKQLNLIAGSININKGQSTIIKVNNGSNLTWTGNDIITNWGDSIQVKPITTSTYKVTGINANGCNDTAEITINVSNVGVKEFRIFDFGFRIFPNPAKEEIIVSGFSLMNKNASFVIQNTLGQTLLDGFLNDDQTPINISALPSGIYFIKVANEVRKFVKE